MARKVHLGLRVPQELKDAIARAADHFGVDATEVCTNILRDKLTEMEFMGPAAAQDAVAEAAE